MIDNTLLRDPIGGDPLMRPCDGLKSEVRNMQVVSRIEERIQAIAEAMNEEHECRENLLDGYYEPCWTCDNPYCLVNRLVEQL